MSTDPYGDKLYAGSGVFSSLTSGRIVYASTDGLLVDSSALTFDGSNLGVGTLALASGSITDSGGTISLGDDTLTTSGEVNANSGNATAKGGEFGAAFIGTWALNNSYAVFCHKSLKSNSSAYAFLQKSTGRSFFNAALGQPIDFMISGNQKWQITSAGVWYSAAQALTTGGLITGGTGKFGDIELDGDLNHDGSNVGFYGTAPVAQGAAVADATDAATAISQLNLLLARIRATGLIAT